MWIFIGAILLIFGIWQAFQLGTWSSRLSGIGIYSGLIILFIASWKIGLILLCLFGIFLLFSKGIGNDRKKIKRIIQTFKKEKELNPNASEDAVCRKIIASRLYITRKTNPIGIQSIDDATSFVNNIFPGDSLTVSSTCHWIISHEKGSSGSLLTVQDRNDLNKLFAKKDKLDKIIDNYKKQILV